MKCPACDWESDGGDPTGLFFWHLVRQHMIPWQGNDGTMCWCGAHCQTVADVRAHMHLSSGDWLTHFQEHYLDFVFRIERK